MRHSDLLQLSTCLDLSSCQRAWISVALSSIQIVSSSSVFESLSVRETFIPCLSFRCCHRALDHSSPFQDRNPQSYLFIAFQSNHVPLVGVDHQSSISDVVLTQYYRIPRSRQWLGTSFHNTLSSLLVLFGSSFRCSPISIMFSPMSCTTSLYNISSLPHYPHLAPSLSVDSLIRYSIHIWEIMICLRRRLYRVAAVRAFLHVFSNLHGTTPPKYSWTLYPLHSKLPQQAKQTVLAVKL